MRRAVNQSRPKMWREPTHNFLRGIITRIGNGGGVRGKVCERALTQEGEKKSLRAEVCHQKDCRQRGKAAKVRVIDIFKMGVKGKPACRKKKVEKERIEIGVSEREIKSYMQKKRLLPWKEGESLRKNELKESVLEMGG